MAAIPTAIEQLQAQIPALQKKVNDASDKYNASVAQRETWKQKAQACQAARDTKSLGWEKNKMCDIKDLGTFNANWSQWEQTANSDLAAYNIAKGALDTLNKQIQTAIDQGTAALNTDPTFNLQQQALNNQNAQQTAQLQEQAKTKRTIFVILGIVGGLGALFGMFKLIAHFTGKKTTA